jgi:glycerol-3-phosphate dehydrogenase
MPSEPFCLQFGHQLISKGVVNATGPFSDGLRKLDEPTTKEIVAPSSGVHITLPVCLT